MIANVCGSFGMRILAAMSPNWSKMGYLILLRARFWLSMPILVGLFTRLFGGGSACRDRNSARVTGIGVGIRLYKKYSKQYGQQAAALAWAVTNELFGAPPANEAGRAGYDLEVL